MRSVTVKGTGHEVCDSVKGTGHEEYDSVKCTGHEGVMLYKVRVMRSMTL